MFKTFYQRIVSSNIKFYPCSVKRGVNASVNALSDNKILDWFKLKHSADDNFEFDVNSRKFSKMVENTVSKGEIARYEQFPLFPQCFFKRLVSQGHQKVGMG